jgi:hypothetical protein
MPEGKPQTTGKQEPAFEYDLPSVLPRSPESKPAAHTIPWQVKPQKPSENRNPVTPPPVRDISESKLLNRSRTGPSDPAETESPPSRSRMQTLGWIGLGIVVVLGVVLMLKNGGTNEVAARAEPLATPSKSPEKPAGATPAEDVRSTDGRFQIVVFPSSGVQLIVDDKSPQPIPPFIDLAPGSHRLYFTAQGYSPELLTPEVTPGERRNLTVFLKTLAAKKTTTEPVRTPAKPSPAPAAAAAAAKKAGPVGTAPEPPVVAAPGTLAVSAPVPVEIFEGTQDLGTTPATLELSPGAHTLEYRYGNLKKTLTHTIRSGESMTSTVTFDVVVQINARPWAQVFIDGIQPRTLGQTPLSDVKVSAGTVLIFKHPSFPEKKVRVTGEATTIQVVFP